MRLPGDYEYSDSRLSMKYMAAGVSLCLLLILGVVIWTNKEADAKRHKEKQETETPVLVLEHEGGGQAGNNAAGNNAAGNSAAGTGAAGAANGAAAGAGGSGAANETAAGAGGPGAANGTAAGTGSGAAAGTAGETGTKADTVPAEAVMGFNGSKSMEMVERLYAEHRLVASDLDFWDMYPETPPDYMQGALQDETAQGGTEEPKDKYARYEEEAEKESRMEEEKTKQDPSKDGKHTLVTLAGGEEEWVLINPYLEKNTYDFSNLTMRQKQLAYYADGKTYSYVGADLSKYNEEVDFKVLKESGVSFVMLRLGMRGYGSGELMTDEKFAEYMAKAMEAELNIGVYFYSQAITEEEAAEEANFVIQNLENYPITYPVAFDMEYVANDTARVESLTREEKTKMAKVFLDTVKEAGYKPMVYGTKEWLLKQVDLTKLTDYDIWLSQQEEVPDYPYQFQMWQYSKEGNLNGVNGNVNLNISFVDYSEK